MRPKIIYGCVDGLLDEVKTQRFCQFWLRFRLKRMLVRNGHHAITPLATKDLKGECATAMWESELYVQKHADRFMKNDPAKKYSCVHCKALVVGARWCPDCWKNRKAIEAKNLANTLAGGSLADPIRIEYGEESV